MRMLMSGVGTGKLFLLFRRELVERGLAEVVRVVIAWLGVAHADDRLLLSGVADDTEVLLRCNSAAHSLKLRRRETCQCDDGLLVQRELVHCVGVFGRELDRRPQSGLDG